jgi:SnoaL-like domain
VTQKTRVVRSADCGNSPKNQFLETLAIALAKRDAKAVLGSVTDEVEWNIVGSEHIQGKESLAEALSGMAAERPAKLTILHVVSHGKAGAVNGRMEYRSARPREFCDVYEFSSAKGTRVSRITSYGVEV